MITLKPFAALRPSRDKVHLVTTRNYFSYSDEELDYKLKNNSYTFLHVINPVEGKKPLYGEEKCHLVKKAFEQFKQKGVFIKDRQENFYLYRQIKGSCEYIGLIGAVSVEDYRKNRIKKHENTFVQREQIFADYLKQTGFNAEPVLLTYRDDLRLNELFAKVINESSEYEFISIDEVRHQLWVIGRKEDIELIIRVFKSQQALYIVDGHHRCASSLLLSERMNSQGGHEYFMAFLIGEEQVKVYDFNRLINGLNGKPISKLLSELKEDFSVAPMGNRSYKPEKLHEISMYVEHKWYKLMPKTRTLNPHNSIEVLDAQILSDKILKPILGIKKLKIDNRIGFLPGTEGLEKLRREVDNGLYDIAFALFPINICQIKQIADADITMFPKSTYIEPKLRSGLIIYEIFN